MSLSTVLDQAVAVTATAPGLVSAMNYHPLFIDPQDMPVAVMWIGELREERNGYGGVSPAGGRKWRHMTVYADVRQTSHEPKDDEPKFRALLEAIAAVWRVNQFLGGTTERFGEDITIEIDRPDVTEGSTVAYRALMSSQALEEIVA